MRNIGLVVALLSALITVVSWRDIVKADRYIKRNESQTMINLAVAAGKLLFFDETEQDSDLTVSWGLSTLDLNLASAEELREYREDKVFHLSVSGVFFLIGLTLMLVAPSGGNQEPSD
jgi:hypothetical protein